jgi:ABC-2 type transport system ATP-binding protein
MSFGFESVTVLVGGRRVLDDVDLRVEPGKVTTVIGADGAGKTSAARTLVGLMPAESGTVLRPSTGAIGYQPEAAGTWPDLTVAENLDFVSAAYDIPADSARRHELLALTGLGDAIDRLAGALSGGMRQKLAVAMAMLPSPELTVLDEPTTGLDPLSRAEIWRLLARAAAEGTAILATTTYLDEAERASHVVVLEEGRVLVSGDASTIKSSFRGLMATMATRPEGMPAWRRGTQWRVWARSGPIPEGARNVEPDLDDVVTAAALSREGR